MDISIDPTINQKISAGTQKQDAQPRSGFKDILQQLETEKETTSTAREEFLKYMNMTPEERFFESFLKREGLSQEAFESLPPEKQEALMEKFHAQMQEQAEITFSSFTDRRTD